MDRQAIPAASRVGIKQVLVAAGGGLLLIVVIVAAALVLGGGGSSRTVTYVVSGGTGERLDRGESVELMPAEVRLNVGDTLVIRNEDDRDYVVGPYFVRAGETISQSFTQPQELEGACELSGHGTFRIVVTGSG